MNYPKIVLPPAVNPNTPRNEAEFYTTLRRYTQRLKQERDISLSYLNRINQLQALLRAKDSQIDRLNRINKDLADKLSLYTSVLEKSQPRRSMRMSMLIGKNNMTESIIQTKQQQSQHHPSNKFKTFEQFFIIDLSEATKGHANFRFMFETNNNQPLKFILDLLISNSSYLWEPEPVGLSTKQKKTQYVLYLSNSQKTSMKRQDSYNLVEETNPSHYYFITCMIQKQVMSIGGKFYWVPIAYGFISLLPVPDVYFRFLQQISMDLKLKSESEQKNYVDKVLVDSLNQLMKCPVQYHTDCRFIFLNKIHFWKMPDQNNFDSFALIFSIGVIQKFTLQLIIDVLMLILLQIPITVISQDELMLCQFMFFFLYIIKPLKYPYPIIFNITQKLKDLLQSPFPTFTGCTESKIIDPFLNERAVFDLDMKVAKSWPLLDHLDSSRQFLMKTANRAGNYSNFRVVTEQIIKGHQYRQLQPYWKDFSKTQLYQNYIHRL